MRKYVDMSRGGVADIWSWIQEKRQVEVQLAWELVEVFNSQSMLKPLKDKCAFAIGSMQIILLTELKGLSALKEALHEERNLRIVKDVISKRVTIKGTDAITEYDNKLKSFKSYVEKEADVQDLCEFIRLYGEFVEQGRKHGIRTLAELDQVRQNYKHKGDQGPIWAKEEGARARDFLRPENQQKMKKVYEEAIRNAGPVREFLRSMGGGMHFWIEKQSSTMEKINKMFGLTSGADISGTTTDTAFFIDKFALGSVSPIYYLLPCASIVALGHHTTLEVGAALSVSEWKKGAPEGIADIHYSIGLYPSLLPGELAEIPPREGDCASVADGAGMIRSKLQMAQKDPRNRLMLVFYPEESAQPNLKGHPAGCYLFDKTDQDEMKRYKKACKITEDFLVSKFKNYQYTGNFPTEKNVNTFLDQAGLSDLRRRAWHIGVDTDTAVGVIAADVVSPPLERNPKLEVVKYYVSERTGGRPQWRSKDGKVVFEEFDKKSNDHIRRKDKGAYIIKIEDKLWIATGPTSADFMAA